MASTLLELRKKAGYKSAKEFACAMGIPVATYSRYESNPDKIPLKSAWAIADKLGCSIDAVVGRKHVDDAETMKGEVQREYEGLNPDTRALVDEFRAFARERDRKAAHRRKAEEDACAEGWARHYERLLMQEADAHPELADVAVFGNAAQRREALRSFISGRAAITRAKRVTACLDEEEIVDYYAAVGIGDVDETGHFTAYGKAESSEQKHAAAELAELVAEIESKLAAEDDERTAQIMTAYDRIHSDEQNWKQP